MRKEEEMRNPKSCFNKANYDEIVFVLLERDPKFSYTVLKWAMARVEDGIDAMSDLKIVDALRLAADVAAKGGQK